MRVFAYLIGIRVQTAATILVLLSRRQLGDVARYAPGLIKSQRLGNQSIAQLGVAIDLGSSVGVGLASSSKGAQKLRTYLFELFKD